jgi:REP element-mobilizing transposase RayT
MGHSYTASFVHYVFSTKSRQPFISSDCRDRLYAYIGGICRTEKCTLLSAGGMPDHIHLAIQHHPNIGMADLMRLIKTNSSGWMHETFATQGNFEWQPGYGAFSVSKSELATILKYIENQEVHHRQFDFKQEYLALLRKHGVEFDERYVFTE